MTAVRRAIGKILATALFWGLVAHPAGAADADLEASRRRLAEIEERIEAAEASLAEKSRGEQRLLADLEAVAKERRRIGRNIERLQRELETLGTRVAAKQDEVADLRSSVATLRRQVEKRLAAMYKTGEGELLRLLFSGTSPEQIARDYHYFSRIVRHDRELVASYRQRLAEQEAALGELATLEERQRQTLEAGRQQQQTLRRAEGMQNRLLARLREERADLARTLEELRDRARRLADLVKSLESEKPPEYTEKPGLFAAQKGRLAWPLDAPVVVEFGTSRNPELGTLHESQGVELAAGTGRPVAAVWGGRVAFANWFKGYGNLLILDHGGGFYTLYARIARLDKRTGETVAAGDVLGLTGYEDDPNLYFEIRRGGTPINPRDWLAPR